MRPHIPQLLLTVLLTAPLAGNEIYDDQVYDRAQTYTYGTECTINSWEVACNGPSISANQGGEFNYGEISGNVTFRSSKWLTFNDATFQTPSTLDIYCAGATSIYSFVSYGQRGRVNIYHEDSADTVSASLLYDVDLSVLAPNASINASSIYNGAVNLNGKQVTLGSVNTSDVAIQAKETVILNDKVELMNGSLNVQGIETSVPDIIINAELSTYVINLNGKNITGSNADVELYAKNRLDIHAAANIDVKQSIRALVANISSSNGDINLSSLKCSDLNFKAENGNINIKSDVTAERAIMFTGSSVFTKSIRSAAAYLTSTTGNIFIDGDLHEYPSMHFQDKYSTNAYSAGDIIVTGYVNCSLRAEAGGTIKIAGSISGQNVYLGSGEILVIDQFSSGNLVAHSDRDMTINLFSGTTLEASADGVLTIIDTSIPWETAGILKLSSSKQVLIGETVSGSAPNKLVRDFDVTYTGNGEDPGYGVDVLGWIQGDFKATAVGGSVNAGIITGNANVEAKSIYLSALLDGDLAFKASNTVTLVGNVSADDLLKIEGKLENGVETRANITFKGSLTTGSTGTIHLHGKNVTGATEARETVNAAYIDIDASESVDIKHVFIGGNLVVRADKGVTLAAVGDAEHSVGAAELTCDNGGVTIGSFNGFSLSATAANDLTVLGSAVSMGEDMWGNTGDILLKGASVTTQAIASDGEVYLQGTSGDFTVQNDETKPSLDVGGSINAQLLDATAAGSISVAGDLTTDTGATLEAGGNISFDRNAVVRGSLDATAAGSVTMDGFFYDCETVDVKAGDAVKLGMVGALHIPVEIGGQEEDHPVGDANISSSNGPVTIFCFAGDTLNASAGGALTIEEADEDSGIVSTGEGRWSADGTERGPFAVRLVGSSISAQYITSTDAVYLQSTGGDYSSEGNELLPSIAVEGDVNTNALQATAAGSIELRGAVNIIGDGGPDSIIKTGGQVEFGDQLTVVGTTLNIMNISEAANLSVADVTIGNRATMGVYTGEADEGTLTIAGDCTLTAGAGATLNANLVMEEGSTLDVSAAEGIGGLLMGSTVTMSPGSVALSAADMAAVGNLGFMQAYDLFSGVDSFSIGGTAYSEITFSDEWVKAAEVFNNDLFQDGGKEYYLFYSGASQGGAGGNAGTVYLMRLPEPATSTLGLLALAALAARRRRK